MQKLPRLVKDNIKPWVLYGRTVLMKRTKVKPVHDFLFMDPHRGEPLDGRRFSELLMEVVEASCSCSCGTAPHLQVCMVV